MSNRVAPGTLLAEKYRLVSMLGRGGMGEVWRAEHLALRAPVAIKLMNPETVSNPEALARFNREAQAAASLRSPHVVQILDHGLDPILQVPFIAMELMEGESLAARLDRVGRLSAADTVRIVTHIARALARSHDAGIVHRDLKPDNVFLVRGDDEEIAKVLDFGIAKANTQSLEPSSVTRTGAVMGTPYYMSPEQISGAKSVDFRTDLWALGVIACQCLTGKLPFEADTIGGLALAICAQPIPRPSQLGPTPPAFDGWFERAMARPPEERFQSARELAEELRSACGLASSAQIPPSAPVDASPVAVNAVSAFSVSNTGARAPLHASSKPSWLMAGLLALVASLALSLWFFGRSRALPGAASAAASAPLTTSVPLPSATATLAPEAHQIADQAPSFQPAVSAVLQAPAPSAKARPTAAPGSARPAAHSTAVPPPLAPPKPKPDLDSTVFDRRKG